jgi:hypothetical protein
MLSLTSQPPYHPVVPQCLSVMLIKESAAGSQPPTAVPPCPAEGPPVSVSFDSGSFYKQAETGRLKLGPPSPFRFLIPSPQPDVTNHATCLNGTTMLGWLSDKNIPRTHPLCPFDSSLLFLASFKTSRLQARTTSHTDFAHGPVRTRLQRTLWLALPCLAGKPADHEIDWLRPDKMAVNFRDGWGDVQGQQRGRASVRNSPTRLS